jgi:hypothetical protein
MNKRTFSLLLAAVLAVLGAGMNVRAAARTAPSQIVRNQFFIISEVNLQKHNDQLVLELPSEITMLMTVNAKTAFINEQGRHEPLRNIRPGDTVYITFERQGKGGTALSIREGPMTVQILHARYFKS